MTNAMNLGDSIRSGTQWLMYGKSAIRVFQFAFGIVLARLLMPEDFGMLVTMQIFTGLAGYFSGGGMGQALVQAKHVTPRHYQVVFTLQLATGILVYLGFFLISPWFANWFDTPLYRDLLRVSALTFLLRPVANVNNAKLHRDMRFKEQSATQFVSSLITGVTSIILALVGMGVWGLVIAGILGSIINTLLLLWVARQKPEFAIDMEIARSLGAYGVKVSANDIIAYLSKQVSNLIISRFLGAASVGLFNKAFSLKSIPDDIILGSAYQTVFRALSKVQDDRGKSQYLFYRSIAILALYTWPIYMGLCWVAHPLIYVLYGTKWVAASEPLRVLSLVGFSYCIGYQCGAVVAAQNKLGRELIIQTEQLILLALACFVGMNWGITGVAWAMIPVHIYVGARILRLANSCIGTTVSGLIRHLKPAFLLNGILFLVLWLCHFILANKLSFLGPAFYLVCMVLAGTLSYSLAFLFLPIEALSTEATRWKRIIGLVQAP